jgi:hypothetical protein
MTPTEIRHKSKTKLLDAALHVIRAKGYSATRVEDICEVAARTKGSFYPVNGTSAASHTTRRNLMSRDRGSSHIQPKTSVKDIDLTLIQWETRLDVLFLPRHNDWPDYFWIADILFEPL